MKYVGMGKLHRGRHSYVFSIDPRERLAFLSILQMYPVLDASYHRLSRRPSPAEQQWLEETIEQQKKEHKKRLQEVFSESSGFFKESKSGFRFSLTAEQMEWLLRVLNDIRVGSWVQLGKPEMETARRAATKSGLTHYLASMDLSGYFQSVLLDALNFTGH